MRKYCCLASKVKVWSVRHKKINSLPHLGQRVIFARKEVGYLFGACRFTYFRRDVLVPGHRSLDVHFQIALLHFGPGFRNGVIHALLRWSKRCENIWLALSWRGQNLPHWVPRTGDLQQILLRRRLSLQRSGFTQHFPENSLGTANRNFDKSVLKLIVVPPGQGCLQFDKGVVLWPSSQFFWLQIQPNRDR